jgi:secreted Zn-dependent insulinase-like peptidase
MEDFIRSKSDKRTYRYITLDNKIRALLVHDPEGDKSAANMRVQVGCTEDPEDRLGLAHFLEHMLFMGSEKYPDENEYAEFITNNGGMNNAWTYLDQTNYHFDISNEAFEKAVDMFA